MTNKVMEIVFLIVIVPFTICLSGYDPIIHNQETFLDIVLMAIIFLCDYKLIRSMYKNFADALIYAPLIVFAMVLRNSIHSI